MENAIIEQATKVADQGSPVALVAVIYMLIEMLKFLGFQKRRGLEKEAIESSGCSFTQEERARFMELRDMARDSIHDSRLLIEQTKELAKSVDRFSISVDSLVDTFKDELKTLHDVIARIKRGGD